MESSNKILAESVSCPKDAERGGGVFNSHPIVAFIPEVLDGDSRETHVEITLRVNLRNKAEKNNSVKKRVKVFSVGSIESLLRWKRDLEDVIRQKPVTNPIGMFDMAEMLLADDPLATFQETRRSVCQSVPVGGTLEDAMGENVATFGSVMNRFLHHYFPNTIANAAAKQKRYMRSNLRKPDGVRVKQVFTRIMCMNALLPLFPPPDNRAFTDNELVDIIVAMMPNKWHVKMNDLMFDPNECELMQLQTTLERVELSMDLAAPKSAFLKKAGASGKQQRSKGNGKASTKECTLCKLLVDSGEKAVFKGHTFEDCFRRPSKKKKDGASGGPKKRKHFESTKKRSWPSHDRKAFAIMADSFAKQWAKKRHKKHAKLSESSSSESE